MMTWEELLDLLKTSKSEKDIDSKRNEITEWIPQVERMFGYNQENSFHQYDLWMHSIHTVLTITKNITDDMLYLAALLHDIGKPDCKCYEKENGKTNAHYPNHPEKSEQIVRDDIIPELVSKGVSLSQNDIKRLLYYVRFHNELVPVLSTIMTEHLKNVDIEAFTNLMVLQIADASTQVRIPVVQLRIDVCSKWLELFDFPKFSESMTNDTEKCQIRKYQLFKKLNSDIENFIHEFRPTYTDDEELIWLMMYLQFRMKEINDNPYLRGVVSRKV